MKKFDSYPSIGDNSDVVLAWQRIKGWNRQVQGDWIGVCALGEHNVLVVIATRASKVNR